MSKEIIFVDDTNDKLKIRAFINEDNRVFIECGDLADEDYMYNGYVTLDKIDLEEFISYLTTLKNSM